MDTMLATIGIVVKEPWAVDISYEMLNYSLYRVEDGGDGCGYIALKDNIGVTPGSDDTVWRKAVQAGQSIYDLAVKYHHFVGTEEEFEAQYQAALQAAIDAAAGASAAEAQVEAAEAMRVQAESSRESAETARAAAESARATAEASRDTAESSRASAESSRVSAETGRSEAETARQTSETTRQGNEEEREEAEGTRTQQFEALKADMQVAIGQADAAASAATEAAASAAQTESDIEAAEASRVTAEQGRVTAEQGRASAEQGRVSAESARVTAEAARETQAEADHARAGSDHTQAGTDHTQAAADHTRAESDHTQAAADHTQAGSDHAVVESYNTRLTNVEGEVSQLGQKVVGIIGDNIQTTWTENKKINLNGNVADSEGDYASGFIPVFEGQTIHIVCSANGSHNNVCCFYDENKVKVGTYFQVNDADLPNGISKVVPQNGYVRLSNDASKVAQPYLFVEKVSGNIETLKLLTNKVLDIDEIGKNIYEELPVSWIDGQFINLHGNLSSNASKQASDWIPVKAGEKYMLFVNASGANNDVLALYNEGKTFLSYIQISALYYFNGYLLTIAQDGYFRTSNTPAEVSNPKIYKIINASNSKLVGDIGYKIKNIIEPTYKLNPTGELSIKWQSGWGVRYNGTVSHSTLPEGSTGVKCSDYIFLQKGQTIKLNYWAVSPYAHVIYDLDKETISSYFYSDVKEPVFYYATQDCYIRITSILNDLGIKESAHILLNTTTLDATRVMKFIQKDSFVPLMNQNNKSYNFTPLLRKSDKKYAGQVSPQKRYLYCGFDDFRPSDFEWVIPLFAKYGFKATFNRIHKDIDANNEEDAARVNMVYFSGNELGDHTLYHSMYPFFSPLWNGQNPSSVEGSQTPFPSNSQMRDEVANTGKNVFGVSLTSNPIETLPLSTSLGITTPWGQLSDAECQTIREYYSVMKSTAVVSSAGNKTMIQCLDLMSNKYLGTTGSSNGSWDATTQKYTGGIFTGCATSQNHEIWERILQCVASYYKEEFNFGDDIVTWSLPGSANGSLYFSDANGYKYYDEQKTKLANCNAKFESSLYKNLDGTPKLRSWTDVLREYGYNNTHDQYFPSRYDGTDSTVMSHQFIINSKLSRKDGIPYSTELDVMWYQDGSPYTDFTEAFFQSHNTYDYPTEMYNYHKAENKGFYKTIENLRHLSANGVLCGSQWDSQYQAKPEQIYWEGILQYCKATGVEILTKAEAFDVAFNHSVECGNLIYNPLMRNTAKEFMPNADVPTNPDGYVGNCSVNHDSNNVPILVTTGDVVYNHFGIPVGDIKYSAMVKGSGTITIKVIKNRNKLDLSDLSTIAVLQIDSSSEFTAMEQNINIYDAANTAWEQIFEGLGDKICGIQIIYSSGLEVKDIKLYKNLTPN